MRHHRRRHEPDGTGTRDEHVFAEDRELEGGVDRVPERVEDGGYGEIDARDVPPHVGLGDGDEVGEGSGKIDPDSLRLLTQMAPPGEAVATAAADDMALGADDLAYLEPGNIGPDLDDPACEFVTHGHRRRNRGLSPLVPVVDVDVGAADPRGEDFDQDVVGPDRRHGHVVESQAGLIGVLDQSPHRQTGSISAPAAA